MYTSGQKYGVCTEYTSGGILENLEDGQRLFYKLRLNNEKHSKKNVIIL